MPPKAYRSIQVYPQTWIVLDEIRDLIGRDELGRTPYDYEIAHRALLELRDKLKAEKPR